MKVLHVVPTYWPAVRYGGPIYSVHGLCAALAKKNIDVSVFTTSVDGKNDSDVEHGKAYSKDGVKIFYYQSRYLRRIYFSHQLKQALTDNIDKFDLVHLHSVFLYPTNVAACLAKSHSIPYILSPRGMLEKALIKNKSALVKHSWLRLIEKKNLEQSSLIHLTSEREREELKKFSYSFPEMVVIPNGIDSDLIGNHKSSRKSQEFQILFLGRLSWKKQINKLIESLVYLDFRAKLIVAGNDEEQYSSQLESLINQLNNSHQNQLNVVFVGAKYGCEKKELLQSSDVMVLPSLSENFGNTVIEAMAAGCPVIVTPEVGASEIVEVSGSGLITNGTPQDIAEKIGYVRANQDEAKQMSSNGINEIKQNYLWSNIADSMISSYQKLIV